jgi:hypothetical protein
MKALRGKPNSKDSFLSDFHQALIPSKVEGFASLGGVAPLFDVSLVHVVSE